MNDIINLLTQFKQFQKTMQGKDPKAMLQQMISSGQVSQSQVEQAKEKAEQLSQFLGIIK